MNIQMILTKADGEVIRATEEITKSFDLERFLSVTLPGWLEQINLEATKVTSEVKAVAEAVKTVETEATSVGTEVANEVKKAFGRS